MHWARPMLMWENCWYLLLLLGGLGGNKMLTRPMGSKARLAGLLDP